MRLTTDANDVDAKFRAAFGNDFGAAKRISRSGTYALTDDSCAMLFEKGEPGVYYILMGIDPAARGKSGTEFLSEALAWMFTNTDALIVRGWVDPENKAALGMVANIEGATTEERNRRYLCGITIAKWAKAYGIEKALSEMRAAGQSEKADKLEAAAKAAGVL